MFNTLWHAYVMHHKPFSKRMSASSIDNCQSIEALLIESEEIRIYYRNQYTPVKHTSYTDLQSTQSYNRHQVIHL
jgi:hypothetical protein